MIKIGVLGAGHLGKIHIRLILELSDLFHLVGFYDPNAEQAKNVAEEFGITYYDNIDALISNVDAVDIVTPTLAHFDCAQKALLADKHVFIEKPVTETLNEAKELIALGENKKRIIQVGHVERFNPAFQAALPYFGEPMFIETHRLAQFNPRGCDVPVVLDLMIHDIDIILSVVKSPVSRISASGVAVVSDTPDIANARIEFENGCVANLTTSRISMKNMRKSRFFQKNAYISVDFLTKQLEVITMEDVYGEPDPFDVVINLGNDKPGKKIMFDKPQISDNNAIKDELINFANAINSNTKPLVTIQDGFNALHVAHMVLEEIEK